MSCDVCVVGTGVFGAWTGLMLRRSGARVLMVDQFGPGNSRQSSGGESRVLRAGYGSDAVYTRFAQRSLHEWKDLMARTGERLFHETGVLWMARAHDALTTSTVATLRAEGVPHELLDRDALVRRYPQIDFGPVSWGVVEPTSGVLMARRAVQAAVRQAIAEGATFEIAAVPPPAGRGRLASVTRTSGATVAAGVFVFALGPWLGKAFPTLLGDRIHPTRQEVFYFGTPPGDARFAPPAMPAWIDFGGETYGIPDIEAKGFKIAPDAHGPPFDPDDGERVVAPATLAAVRAFAAARFPALRDAPLVASEVCQYENSSNGDFLIDRHPDFDNVWLVGGGSGHGFKHGPAVGEYVAARIADGRETDARFSLASKAATRARAVF